LERKKNCIFAGYFYTYNSNDLMKRLVFLILLTGMFVFVNAQNSNIAKYWIQFKNKEGAPYSTTQPEAFLSPKAIEKRKVFHIPVTEQDFPVNKNYIDSLLRFDTTMRVLTRSKWFNGITVYSEHPSLIDALKHIGFVADCEETIPLKEREQIASNVNQIYEVASIPTGDELNINDLPMSTLSDYGRSWSQLTLNKAQWLPRMGYSGKGVTLMVMDAGFQGVDTIRQFACLRNSKRLLGARNFVQPSVSPYVRGSHGTMVLSCIASLLPGSLIGTAPGVSVWLAQTEDGRSEHQIEEDNWVAGIEWADSLGCDILNSSLGYTQFDNKKPNRACTDLTGRVSRASQAATIAAEKGMIVCNSMGNEGVNKWRYICFPADAHDILSVGAAARDGSLAAFSSHGPTADGRTKPDACALGLHVAVANSKGEVTIASGTSFASPLLCGMVACLKEAFPHHSSYAIMNAVRQSGSCYASPTPGYGYGITDMLKAWNILNNPEMQFCMVNFENYTTASHKIRVTFETRKPMKLTVKQKLRGSSKEHVKKYSVKHSKTVTLKTPSLNRNKKWGIVDITVSPASLKNMKDMNLERASLKYAVGIEKNN
jgi:subtilisin family serine protease